MKRKGFTLVELIAVIAILGVILTIAGISIVSIKKNVLEKQKSNLQATIRAAAEGYHSDTGIDSIPVGVLIQIGAIQADEVLDDGTPVIYDPMDGRDISCDTIEFDAEGNSTYKENETCDSMVIAENALNLNIKVGSEEKQYEDYLNNHKGWIAPLTDSGEQKVIFSSVVEKIKSGESSKFEYAWTNPLNPDKSEITPEYELPIPDSKFIDADYNLHINLKGTESSEGSLNTEELSKDFHVNLDAKKPTIADVTVVPNEDWAKSKKIVAKFIDNESGLDGYKILRGNNKDCKTDTTDWKTISGQPHEYEMVETVDVNSQYYKVCVKDYVGYITSTEFFEVKNVDGVPPVISVSADSSDWAQTHTATVTVTEKGPDGITFAGFGNEQLTYKYLWSTSAKSCTDVLNSGTRGTINVSNNGSGTFTATFNITGETGSGKVYVCAEDVHDRLGNKTEATTPATVSVKMDNQAPTIGSVTVSSTESSYNSAKVNVSVSNISDSHSGVTSLCLSTSSNYESCTNWVSTSSSSYTFSNQSAGSDGSGSTTTFYAFAKDAVGNVMTTGVSEKYTIYKYCTDKTVSSYGEYGPCSKACDEGTKYRDVTYIDTHFQSYGCGTVKDGDSASCNTMECCTPTTIIYKDGNTCSASCDWGTYNRLAYSTYDNTIRCYKFDKSSGGADCYLKACCSEGTYSDYDCTWNGYIRQRRYNECLGEYQYKETSRGCNSPYSYGPWSGCSASCGSGTKTRSCTYYYAGSQYNCTADSTTCTGSNCPQVTCYLRASHSGNTFNPFWSPSACAPGSTSSCSGTSCTVSGVSEFGDRASNGMCYCNGDGYYACNGGNTLSCCSGTYCLI